MKLGIREHSSGFVAEVTGINLATDCSDSVFEQVRAAWQEYPVLFFRRQCLSEAELIRFSSGIGRLEVVVRTDNISPYHPEVAYVSNLRNGAGKLIGALSDTEVGWHSDQSYRAKPATGALLYGVEVPPKIGNTFFANQYLAYESLPESLQAKIAGQRGVFSYAARMEKFYPPEQRDNAEVRARAPDVTHPVVLTHPVTGRKSLYADPTTLISIGDLGEDENSALLERLRDHATRPEFVYSHDWEVGDVLMWDNGCMLHRRDAFDSQNLRLLKRTTLFLPPDQHCLPA